MQIKKIRRFEMVNIARCYIFFCVRFALTQFENGWFDDVAIDAEPHTKRFFGAEKRHRFRCWCELHQINKKVRLIQCELWTTRKKERKLDRNVYRVHESVSRKIFCNFVFLERNNLQCKYKYIEKCEWR